jgi:hypothetical protein
MKLIRSEPVRTLTNPKFSVPYDCISKLITPPITTPASPHRPIITNAGENDTPVRYGIKAIAVPMITNIRRLYLRFDNSLM